MILFFLVKFISNKSDLSNQDNGFKIYFDILPQNLTNQTIEEPDFDFQQYCLKSNDTLKDTYYEKYFQSKIKLILKLL